MSAQRVGPSRCCSVRATIPRNVASSPYARAKNSPPCMGGDRVQRAVRDAGLHDHGVLDAQRCENQPCAAPPCAVTASRRTAGHRLRWRRGPSASSSTPSRSSTPAIWTPQSPSFARTASTSATRMWPGSRHLCGTTSICSAGTPSSSRTCRAACAILPPAVVRRRSTARSWTMSPLLSAACSPAGWAPGVSRGSASRPACSASHAGG